MPLGVPWPFALLGILSIFFSAVTLHSHKRKGIKLETGTKIILMTPIVLVVGPLMLLALRQNALHNEKSPDSS